ncbi:MAG: hypothetical protein IBX64_13730 [Actinobacteria bacterium]|nr:hypothetical protein [Actinomycetota bacterium]
MSALWAQEIELAASVVVEIHIIAHGLPPVLVIEREAAVVADNVDTCDLLATAGPR